MDMPPLASLDSLLDPLHSGLDTEVITEDQTRELLVSLGQEPSPKLPLVSATQELPTPSNHHTPAICHEMELYVLKKVLCIFYLYLFYQSLYLEECDNEKHAIYH